MSDKRQQPNPKQRKTKDRVLQARIPEDLDEELRGRAEELGMSVSNVVRNVLLHTFNLVENVVSDSAHIARAIQGRDASPASASAATEPPDSHTEHDVIGWQVATLNRNGVCDQCNTILKKGQTAAVGVPVQSRPVLLCLVCMDALTTNDTLGGEP